MTHQLSVTGQSSSRKRLQLTWRACGKKGKRFRRRIGFRRTSTYRRRSLEFSVFRVSSYTVRPALLSPRTETHGPNSLRSRLWRGTEKLIPHSAYSVRNDRPGYSSDESIGNVIAREIEAPGLHRALHPISIVQYRVSFRSIGNRETGLRGRRAVCANAKDDGVCEEPSLRSGECVRE